MGFASGQPGPSDPGDCLCPPDDYSYVSSTWYVHRSGWCGCLGMQHWQAMPALYPRRRLFLSIERPCILLQGDADADELTLSFSPRLGDSVWMPGVTGQGIPIKLRYEIRSLIFSEGAGPNFGLSCPALDMEAKGKHCCARHCRWRSSASDCCHALDWPGYGWMMASFSFLWANCAPLQVLRLKGTVLSP